MGAVDMAEEQSFITHLVTLLLGGGGVGSAWAYVTKRRESEADRVARFEERMLAEYHRTQDDMKTAMNEVHNLRDKLREEQGLRRDALDDLDRAGEALKNALERVTTLERELRDTRALLDETREQNKLLKARLREWGDELGDGSSDVEVVK